MIQPAPTLQANDLKAEVRQPENFSNWLSVNDWMTPVGLVATIVALMIALYQGWEARKQTIKLKAITDKSEDLGKRLIEISQALSTRYLGGFPEYFMPVADLINKAEKEVIFMCTFPCNGVYSYPQGWIAIKHAVEEFLSPRRDTKIHFVFSSRQVRSDYLRSQFKDADENWEEWSKTEANKHKLDDFVSRLSDLDEPHSASQASALSKEGFFALLDKAALEDIAFFRKLVRNGRGSVSEISHRPPIYAWLADRTEAVFSIPATTRMYEATAFTTIDTRLLSGLQSIFDEYTKGKV
jgi:hypothetical protein